MYRIKLKMSGLLETDMPLHMNIHFSNLVFCLYVIVMGISYGKPNFVNILAFVLCCRCGGEHKTFKVNMNNEFCAY
jgi:hypothetical protein